MPFYVTKGKPEGAYEGKTTLYNGLLYYATNLSKPTEFETEEEAKQAIIKSKELWPEIDFQIVYQPNKKEILNP